PLPHQYGVEARALESLWEVFAQAREAMKRHPGCEAFARRTTEVLNIHVRPVTAKWHRAHSEGRLSSRDGANEFREDLAAVQRKIASFRARASRDGLWRAARRRAYASRAATRRTREH